MYKASGILIACNDPLVIDPATTELPKVIDVLVEGSHGKKLLTDGKTIADLSISGSDIDACEKHFAARRAAHPKRDLAIDYEHQLLSGKEAPAAGWIKNLFTEAREGKKVLRAEIDKWTKRAAEYIRNGEYRYVSPVFALNRPDKETGRIEPLVIKHVSLTNEPFIDDLLPITAKDYLLNTITAKETDMDELISWLRNFLGLPLSATAAEILAELNKLQDKIKSAIASGTVTAKEILAFFDSAATEIAAKADLVKVICAKDAGTIEEAKAIYVTAKDAQTQLVVAKEELTALKAEKFNTAFDGIIGKAFTDGKILPTQKADAAWMQTQKDFAAKDMTAFTEFWAKQPKVAPTGTLPDPGDVAAKDDLSEEDKRIASKMGVSEDTLKKHNKK